jgi:hypothetical protein
MRRLVDLADANRFCAALYPEVLRAIRTVVGADGPPTARVIDWAMSLTVPRVTIGGANPSVVDSWTDPVLYVQDDPFQVVAGSPAQPSADIARLQGRLDFWKGYLATLDPATTDPAIIADVLATIAKIQAILPQGGA